MRLRGGQSPARHRARVTQQRQAGGSRNSVRRRRRGATDRARQYLAGYRPSSPSIALMRDGQVVYMLERSQIENRDALSIASELTAALRSSARRPPPPSGARMPAVSFEGACALLETALDGAARREIVAALSDAKDWAHALRRLRGGMRAHVWKIGERRIDLEEVVAKYIAGRGRTAFRAARLGRQGRPRQRRHHSGRRARLPGGAARRAAAGRTRARDHPRLLLFSIS